jgi:hypothetical protein
MSECHDDNWHYSSSECTVGNQSAVCKATWVEDP